MATSDVKDNSEKLYSISEGLKIAGGGTPQTDEIPPEQRPAPQLRPNGDLVLIRRLEKDEKTGGGIILPECMRQDFFRAEVLAMGRGHAEGNQLFHPADCKVGDIVMVKDECEMPGGRGVIQKHLIPVTPDDKQFVLCPGHMIYAIELPEPPKSTNNVN